MPLAMQSSRSGPFLAQIWLLIPRFNDRELHKRNNNATMSFDKLSINVFDIALVAVLVLGIYRGRKHGMSEELMLLLKWLVIVFACAALYEPLGQVFSQTTGLFGLLGSYLAVYILVG